MIQQYNLTLVGFHMHIGSGVDYHHLSSVCDAMVEQVLTSQVDIQAIRQEADYQRLIKKGCTVDGSLFSLWDRLANVLHNIRAFSNT